MKKEIADAQGAQTKCVHAPREFNRTRSVVMKSILYFVLVVLSLPTFAQNVTFESYGKAREVLDRSIAAYGGMEKLRAIENVTFRAEGDTVHRNQSRKPFTSDRTPFKASYIFDAKNTRYRQSQDGWYPGGYHCGDGFAMNTTE